MTYRQALAANNASIRATKAAIMREERQLERKRAARMAVVSKVANAFAFASFGAMVLGVVALHSATAMGLL